MINHFSNRFLPPYIIYKGLRLFDTWCPRNGYPGTRYNATKSGWVEEPVFYDWFVNHFLPAVKDEKRPILLLMDGYKSHISARLIKMALDHAVHIECLPPHSTTVLQPLDVVTLSKVKLAWRQLLRKHNQVTNSKPIDKPQFALLVRFVFLLAWSLPFFFL
jgi:hypothetical protein